MNVVGLLLSVLNVASGVLAFADQANVYAAGLKRTGQVDGSESAEKNEPVGTAVSVHGSIGLAPAAWAAAIVALIGDAPQPPEVRSEIFDPPLPQWSATSTFTWKVLLG